MVLWTEKKQSTMLERGGGVRGDIVFPDPSVGLWTKENRLLISVVLIFDHWSKHRDYWSQNRHENNITPAEPFICYD